MDGVTQMNIDRRTYYQKELTFTIARSYGPGRYESNYEEKGIDYPIGLVRFTEGRNLEEFIRLISDKRIILEDLITHEIDFYDATRAYEIVTINKNKEKYIAILLKYLESDQKWSKKISLKTMSKKKIDKNKVNLGLIGAGNFARNALLPNMKKTKLYNFRGLASTGGPSAAQANKVFDFEYATNDYMELLKDDEIDLIAISTQHNTHAKFIIEALQADKHVYCEKPMCLTLEELDKIKKAYENSKGELFIGLNRRHAPVIKKIKKYLSTDKIPAVYDYIANVGLISSDHWSQDTSTGGGRIIGEAIHFIDLIQYLDGSELKFLEVKFAKNDAYPNNDNAMISLMFTSGAIGNIIYTSMGSKKYPKEQLRVFSKGQVYEMNNFIKINNYGSVKTSKFKLVQDKGIMNEYKMIHSVLKGKEQNHSIRDAFVSHMCLIKSLNEQQ
jgi:predicted dehydrogenase